VYNLSVIVVQEKNKYLIRTGCIYCFLGKLSSV